MAGRRLIHGEAKAPVASQERAAFAGESRPALRACAAPPLEESEPGGGLELAEVAPEVPVRHAGARRRLADGAERVDEVEERGSTVAELDRLEDDPDLDLRFHAGGPGPSGPSLPMAQHPSGPADDTVIRPTWGPGRGGAPSRGHRGRGEIGSAGSSPHGRRAGMRAEVSARPGGLDPLLPDLHAARGLQVQELIGKPRRDAREDSTHAMTKTWISTN